MFSILDYEVTEVRRRRGAADFERQQKDRATRCGSQNLVNDHKIDVDVDVEDVMAQAVCLYASFSGK